MIDIRSATQLSDIEPPCIKRWTEHELQKLRETGLKTGVPCHTQSTERAVKLTTEAAACVTGAARQDGLSLNELAFRRIMK